MPTDMHHAAPPTRVRSRTNQVELACRILEALASLPSAAAVADVAAMLRRPGAGLGPALATMERAGMIERWTESGPPATARVMLSAWALARIGLWLAPRGDRWGPGRPHGPRGGSPMPADHAKARAVLAGYFAGPGDDRRPGPNGHALRP